MVGAFCNMGRIGVGKTSLNLNYSLTHSLTWASGTLLEGCGMGAVPASLVGWRFGWGKSKLYFYNCIFIGHLGSETTGQ